MIVAYCDICGRELDRECRDQVNLDFNSYGTAGFRLVLNKKDYGKELQLCIDCANSVVSAIEDLKKIAEADNRE